MKLYPENSIAVQSIEESIARTKFLIQTIEYNKGTYLYRSYQAFNDSKYLDRLTSKNVNSEGKRRIDNAVKYVMDNSQDLFGSTITEEQARKQIFDYLEGLKNSNGIFNAMSQGKADAPFLKRRKEVPKPIRELLGESKDPLLNYVSTTFQISNYLASLEYQEQLLKSLDESGLLSYEAQPGYTKLASTGEGWQTLEGVYVPTELKQSIDDLMPLESIKDGFYKAMVKFASFTKIGKTVYSPTTISRNFLSGIYLSFNSGFFFASNPKIMLDSLRQSYGTKKSLSQRRAERDKLIKLGVLNDGAMSREVVETMNDYTKELDRIVKTNGLISATKFAKKIYALGDDFYKVIGFYVWKNRYMKNGMSESEAETKASERIRDTFPTYSLIPRNFQKLRRIPVVGTFVSFPYEVIRTTNNGFKYMAEDLAEGRSKMFFQQAAGMIIANTTLFGLSTLTRNLIGFDDEDDDALRDMLPEWQKNSSLIYVGKVGNKPVFIDGTAFFPGETIIKPIRTLIETRSGRNIPDKIKEALKEVLNPYLGVDISFKTLNELRINKDNYDRKIYEGDNLVEGIINDPEKIANYYLKQAGPGVYNNIVEFMRANEVNPSAFGEKYTTFGREYTNRDALMALLGFRFSTLNYVSGMSNVSYDAKKKFDEKRNEILKRVSTTTLIPEDKMREIVDEYKKANSEFATKIKFGIKGARKLGLSDSEIVNALSKSRISKVDINDLLDGLDPMLKNISKTSENNKLSWFEMNYDDKKKRKKVSDNYLKNTELFNKLINEEYE